MNPSNPKPKQSLYFWAILPPEEIAAEVDALRQEIAARFDTKRALRLPVHLTIYPPFRVRKEDFLLMEKGVIEWLYHQGSFEIGLDGFGFFNKRNPVAFVHVSLNSALKAFERNFVKKVNELLNISKAAGGFNPHMTLAQQDLDRKHLPALKEFLSGQSFHAAFEVHDLCLFRHDGKVWSVEARYAVGR